MRHRALMLVGVMVVTLLPMTVSGCGITCACAITPDPNWTPPPVTAQDSEAAVAKFATGAGFDATGLVASLDFSTPDHPVYEVSGDNAAGVVDGHSALVLEFVVTGDLPNTKDVTVSADAALTAATALLKATGRYAEGLSSTTTLQDGTATSVYVVTWSGQGFDAPGISVSVNPSSGKAFAFADLRWSVPLVVPAIGAAAAGRLAIAAAPTSGLTVQSAELQFGSGAASWTVTLGAPGTSGATASASASDHGAIVNVDAVSGAVTVAKSY
jgi:hypothetical protein